jgi:putative IMPACT (imprinted ancient) family translation regulator
MAVKAASVKPIVPMRHYRVVLQYQWLGRFEQLLTEVDGREETKEFTDCITMNLSVPAMRADWFETRVRETFNARAGLSPL